MSPFLSPSWKVDLISRVWKPPNNHEVKAKKVRNSRSNITEPLHQHLFKDFSLYKKHKLLFFKPL